MSCGTFVKTILAYPQQGQTTIDVWIDLYSLASLNASQQALTTKRQVRQILGLANYTNSLLEIIAPLAQNY